MKRKQCKPASKPARGARTIDPRRLTGVRGGTDLGITVVVPPPDPSIMQMQHNERLIQL
jgi:hypothetical protein